MFQATRRRLAIWYTAVTAMLLLLFASGVYFYVRSTLIERIDDTLNHVVEVVERSLVIEPDYPNPSQLHINIEATFRDNADTVEDDHIDLEWFSPSGKLLWSTLSEPLNIPINSNRTGETVQVVRHEGQGDWGTRGLGDKGIGGQGDWGDKGIGGQGDWGDKGIGGQGEDTSDKENFERSSLLLRQVTQRVQIGRQVIGYLRVSHPWFEVTKPIQQLLVDLSLGTGLMVLSVAASGWFLSGKAMEPVRESYQRLKQFTADASHELRNPIALIQTNVQVALTDPEPELQSHRQQLKVVERLTKRLGRLVDDLLFLARQDSGIVPPQFSACPLDALLMEVVEEQQLIAAEKSITLTLNLVDPPNETTPEVVDNWFTLSGDWNQLARLFTNLLGNAVHYTPNNGKVSVQLQRTTVAKEFSLSPLPTHLQVKIGDTGIGIPESALPHLFDRFYRVDPARTHTATTPDVNKPTGSGLGLAIAAAIVENHQGQIQVASTLHQGTTFTVTLPLLAEY